MSVWERSVQGRKMQKRANTEKKECTTNCLCLQANKSGPKQKDPQLNKREKHAKGKKMGNPLGRACHLRKKSQIYDH